MGLRVGVDLDGVCYDFAASLKAYLLSVGHNKSKLKAPPVKWEFYEDWGFSLDEFKTLCAAGVEAGYVFSYGKPHGGTRAALMSMKNAGHSLHIITDRAWGRPGVSEFATRQWLATHDLPFDSLTFSPDKTCARVDFMIDDKLQNYDALRHAGVSAWLFDRPWNQRMHEWAGIPHTDWRVSTLAEFAKIVSLAGVREYV